MMDLRRLETFLAVADQESFTRAAEELNMAQPTVSAHIHALEETFGQPLFDRMGRKVHLTRAGEVLRQRAREILCMVEEIDDVMKAALKPAGDLRIGALESIAALRLPPILRGYRKVCPDVRLFLETGATAHLEAAVRNREIDVGIIPGPPKDEGLRYERLFTEEVVVVAPPDSLWKRAETVTASDLAMVPLIAFPKGCAFRAALEKHLVQGGVRADHAMSFGSLETIKRSVEAGLGVAVLPKTAVREETAAGRLSVLPLAGAPFRVEIGLVSVARRHLTPAMDTFMELARKELRPTGPVPEDEARTDRPGEGRIGPARLFGSARPG